MDPIQTPVQTPDSQPKSNYLKTIIFSVLIIITLGLIAYLTFQNQNLQKQVLNPPVSPTIQASIPTPQTVSSISIPPDETAGWKTYIDNRYSFKYPDMWLINPIPLNSYTLLNVTNTEKTIEYSLIEKLPGLGLEDLEQIKSENIIIDGKTLEKSTYQSSIERSKYEIWLVLNQGDFIKFDYNLKDSKKALKIFDQILSTFKFTDQSQLTGITEIEKNCISIMGTPIAWENDKKTCNDVAGKNLELKNFCIKNNGKFVDYAGASCVFN